MNENEKKTNIFAIPVFSFIPTKYKELAQNSSGSIFCAVLIVFILVGLFIAAHFNSSLNKFTEELNAACPEFSLMNGEFSIEKPFSMEEDSLYVRIDDTIENVDDEYIKNLIRENFYSQIIVIGKDSFGMYNNGQIQSMDYSSFAEYTFSKSKLINEVIPAIKPIILGCIVVFYLIYIGFYYIAALIMNLVLKLICNIMKKQLSDKETFRISVLSKLPIFILVHIVTLFLPFAIGLWIQIIILILYMITIIKLYDDDSNKYIEDTYYNNDYTE